MPSAYYSNSIDEFCKSSSEKIIGFLTTNNDFPLLPAQRDAWLEEIRILQTTLPSFSGSIFLEYSIPRMGKRIDAVLLIGPVVFILEFKAGEKEFKSHAIDQVWDYALDLKNFHEPSHLLHIAPILIATKARSDLGEINLLKHEDKILLPSTSNAENLGEIIKRVLAAISGPDIERNAWEHGRYCPTPTIIEAATALYHNHSVADIARNDASAINLSLTSDTISEIIRISKERSCKSICFVTGVPGAGKTLVGLNIATKHFEIANDLYSVFLSGNGPLVKILCEALARDEVRRAKERNEKITLNTTRIKAKSFIQNVHHFRDEYLRDLKPPIEHVAIFDEAQRAWDVKQTSNFMRRRRRNPNFKQSEPEFLISCMDRHQDWAVIVCLVGGGQEINTGEAGIGEWIEALLRHFPKWHIYVSSRLTDGEYCADEILKKIEGRERVEYKDELHLAVSMRSFRAEQVSLLVKELLDIQTGEASNTLAKVREKYPIVITRDIPQVQ